MDIRKLQYFLAVAEEGQITKAAKRLHMAQPPLSQQIKLLESELGVRLIERNSGRKITLTDAGQTLRTRAEQILALVDQTVIELKDLTETLPETLSIGISTTWDATFLPDRIRDFHERHPEIRLQLQGHDSNNIEELLTRGIIELAITRFPADQGNFAAISLPDEPFVAAFCPDQSHSIPTNYVRLAELADIPLIIHREHKPLLEYFQQIELKPKIRCRHSDTRSMLAWASTGIGIAIVPKSATSLMPGNTLIIKDIIEPAMRTSPTAVIWLHNRHLSASARHFIDMFMKDSRGQ